MSAVDLLALSCPWISDLDRIGLSVARVDRARAYRNGQHYWWGFLPDVQPSQLFPRLYPGPAS